MNSHLNKRRVSVTILKEFQGKNQLLAFITIKETLKKLLYNSKTVQNKDVVKANKRHLKGLRYTYVL